MRMVDIIAKKRDGGTLDEQELAFFVQGVTDGSLPDYQISALLMAVYLQGMTKEEAAQLTLLMAKSGDLEDLSGVPGIKVDKHSTGGVGDKTTLILAPVVAAAGGRMVKMSGRGLGHTGGTIDKLESIPGFATTLEPAKMLEVANNVGAVVVGQSGCLAPADKALYALRDVTATVSSIPLIAASVMSKKLAAGCDAILLDVKVGSGAFMKTVEDGRALAERMVEIGTHLGRRTRALVTDMSRPLGLAVGNALEVQEAVQMLSGQGPADLRELCVVLATRLLMLSNLPGLGEDKAACEQKVRTILADGSGLAKFKEMVAAQGGDPAALTTPDGLPKAAFRAELKAPQSGWLCGMDGEAIGNAAMLLGAGRAKKGDPIDPAAGIHLFKKTGDRVEQGDTLAAFYAADPALFDEAGVRYLAGLSWSQQPPAQLPALVLAEIG